MWEHPSVENIPETLPWGVRQAPPRRPPAPPTTGDTGFWRPDPAPRSLAHRLQPALLHASTIRLALFCDRELSDLSSQAQTYGSLEANPRAWEPLDKLIDDARTVLHQSFDDALYYLLQHPDQCPDAAHPVTKSWLLRMFRNPMDREVVLQVLERRNLFGDGVSPIAVSGGQQLNVPENCPAWALDVLPPASIVRWFMEDLLRTLADEGNYAELDRFDTVISFPLAALVLALQFR